MPPAMRTLPSGSSVALWPERGLSIGAAAASDPACECEGSDARNAVAPPATLRVMQRMRSRRDLVMTSSWKIRRGATAQVSKTLRSHQLLGLARFVLDDIARHCAGGHGQRRREIHLARPAAPGEGAGLRADYDLIGTRGNSGAGVDAGA